MKPTVLVLFGITGDLARHKVLPAIYHLLKDGHAPDDFSIIGVSRQDVKSHAVVETLKTTLADQGSALDQPTLARLQSDLAMVQMDPQDGESYTGLIEQLSAKQGANVFMYLSLPPQVFSSVITNIAQNGLKHANLLVEKPFGYDYESAERLIKHTSQYFPEEQQYRIDHYLAKEMAQNMLEYRRRSPFLNDLWNSQAITKIEVTAEESIGIAGRTNFYDNIGALRDVIQSHLLQLLAVTMMELPADHSAAGLHAKKQHVLQDIAAANPTIAIRGQYRGYRGEIGDEDSFTETYAELTLRSTDERWQGTKLVVKTGKSLATKYTGIRLTFAGEDNHLEFRIQPGEGIITKLHASQLGHEQDIDTAVNFPATLEAYERVLIDALNADHTLFATDKEVLESWRIVQPVLNSWQQDADGLRIYDPGSRPA